VVQRVHHDASLVGPHGDEILASVERELADADLPFHAVTHHGERIRRHTAIGREIVGAIGS
jgi:hypothetical protein